MNSLRPYPGYGNIIITENEDESNYHSLQTSLTRRLQSGLEFGANYTWSKALDTSGGSGGRAPRRGPEDVYNIARDYGLSAVHRAHNFNGYFIWQIPFLREASNPIVRGALGGWDINGVVVYQSGAPFTVTAPVDAARIGVNSVRATLIGDPNLPSDQRTPQQWFNTAAFLNPSLMTPGEFGNSGRNILIGPSFNRVDLGLAQGVRAHGTHEAAHPRGSVQRLQHRLVHGPEHDGAVRRGRQSDRRLRRGDRRGAWTRDGIRRPADVLATRCLIRQFGNTVAT